MFNISLTQSQVQTLSNVIEKYEDYLFDNYDLRRDGDFRPYYLNEDGEKITFSDPLVLEVVDLDEISSILDLARIEK